MLSPYTVTIYTKQDNPYNVIPDAPIEIRERLANGTSGSLSIIYSDQEGLIPITQTGAKADSNGQFVFYAEAAQYNAVYESQTVPVDVGLTADTLPSAIINDLSQEYIFPTVAAYKAFAMAFPVGKVINLIDRDAKFTVISGTGTDNTYSIIKSDQVSQSISIVEKAELTTKNLGLTDDLSIINSLTYIKTLVFTEDITSTNILTITRSDLRVTAIDKNTGMIKGGAVESNVILEDGARDVEFVSMKIEGNAPDDTTSTYNIFVAQTDNADGLVVKGCNLKRANCAVSTGNSSNFKVYKNNIAELVGSSSGRGYGVISPGDTKTNGRIYKNTGVGGADSGRHLVYVTVGGSDIEAHDNTATDFQQSPFVMRANASQNGLTGCSFYDNKTIGGGGGSVESGSFVMDGKVSDCEMYDNESYDYDGDAFISNFSGEGPVNTDNVWRDNLAVRPTQRAFWALGCKTNIWKGNISKGASAGNTGTFAAFVVQSGGSGGTEVADGNTFDTNIAVGDDHRSAFQINAGSPVPTNTKAHNNTFLSGSLTGRAYELNEASGIVCDFQDNITDQTYSSGQSAHKLQDKSRIDALDFPSIAANSSEELPVTVANIDSSLPWAVTVTPRAPFPSGVSLFGFVSADDTVTVRAVNARTVAVDPANISFIVECRKYNG